MTDSQEERVKRELELLLQRNMTSGDDGSLSLWLRFPELADKLMAWHLRNSPRVQSREEIVTVLHRWMVRTANERQNGRNVPIGLSGWHEEFLEDLLALFSAEKEPKEWCPHICKWEDQWWMATVGVYNGNKKLNCREFKLCPICGAEKPETVGG